MAMAGTPVMYGGIPVLVLKEGTQRQRGRDALFTNILVAQILSDIVKTTLGPKGMNKMLVDPMGEVIITNDGATILDEMDVEHPAAKMIVNVAKTQDKEVGDGTTTAAVLAGELLGRARELIEKEIHPVVIIRGYKMARDKALQILDEIGKPIDTENEDELVKVAITSLGSKTFRGVREKLARIVVRAVKRVAEKKDGKYKVDTKLIQIIKKEGGSIADSQLVDGIVIEKEVVHPNMPKRVKNAKILLLNKGLEVEKTELDMEGRITDPSQISMLLEQEEEMIRKMVDKIAATGANVVITQKGIDDLAQYLLARRGIMAIRRVKKSDLEKIARATGAKIVTNLDEVKPEDLGEAELVEERKIGGTEFIFIEGCKDPKAVTIFIRGPTKQDVDEIERSVIDAIHDVRNILLEPKIVAGGGASEVEVARRLREYAQSVGGREQLAINAFADSLEEIVKAIVTNAGHDALDILVKLRSEHEKGNVDHGFDAFDGTIKNMYEANVRDPVRVKKSVIKTATDVAEMILRIDEMIVAKPEKKKEEKKEEEEEFGE